MAATHGSDLSSKIVPAETPCKVLEYPSRRRCRTRLPGSSYVHSEVGMYISNSDLYVLIIQNEREKAYCRKPAASSTTAPREISPLCSLQTNKYFDICCDIVQTVEEALLVDARV